MKKEIKKSKSPLSQYRRKVVSFLYRLVTKETIVPLHEIEIYVNLNLECSINTDVPYTGYKHEPIILRCFWKKKRSLINLCIFLRDWVKDSNIRFCYRSVTMKAKDLIPFLKNGKKNGDYILCTKNPDSKIVWKVRVRNKINEPDEIRSLGVIGLELKNTL